MTTDKNGLILLYKPPGVTSFKSLGSIKSQLRKLHGNKIKVGHTGTLDKFAEGLLVVLTGKFTRFNQVFTDFDKSYEAEILFGKQTSTLDTEGETVKTCAVPDFSLIERAIPDFTGEIKQRPPIFSAVHVKGERAYKKALRGDSVDLPERNVNVYSFEITGWESPVLHCRISCSKGTYIRSIARDLGLSAGSCASLISLKRLSVGPFSSTESISPEDFSAERDIHAGPDIFERLSEAAPDKFRAAEARPEAVTLMKNGSEINPDFFKNSISDEGYYTVFNGDAFFAYIKYEHNKFSYIFTG